MKTLRNLTAALFALANSIRQLADAIAGEPRSAEWQFDRHLGVHKLVAKDDQRDTLDVPEQEQEQEVLAEAAAPGEPPTGTVFYHSEEALDREAEREAMEQYWESRRFVTDPSVQELRVPVAPAPATKEPPGE